MRKVVASPFRTVGASLLARIATFPITAVAGLLTSYLLISNYGPDAYGVISLLATFFLLIPFADLGMGAPIMNGISSVSITLDRKFDLVRRVFWTLLWSSAAIILVVMLAGLKVSWSSVLGNTIIDRAEFDHAFTVTVVLFLASIPFGIGQRILIGLGLNHAAILIAMSSSVFALVSTYVVIHLAVPSAYAAIAPSSGVLVSSLASFWYGLRRLKMGYGQFRGTKNLDIGNLLQSSAPMFLIMLSVPLAFQSHRIIIAHFGSPDQLAPYALGMQMYIPLWSLVSTSAVALWPIFARRRSAGSDSRRLFVAALSVFTAGGIAAALLMYVAAPIFVGLVSDESIHLDPIFIASLGMLIIIQCIQQVPGTFLTSDYGLKFQSVCVVSMAVCSIALGILLTTHIGVSGPVLATAWAVLLLQTMPGLWKVARITKSGYSGTQ